MSVGYLRRCANKRRHPDKDSAENHRAHLIAQGLGTAKGTNTYPCDQCLSWHVGGTGRKFPRGRRRK